MGVLKVSKEKVGPSPIVRVFMGLNDKPIFPDVCPCCCGKVDQGVYLVARCEGLLPVPFPACGVCVKHTRVENRLSELVGTGLLWLTVLTVAVFFFVRGMSSAGHAGAGSGWQVTAGLLNMTFPFRSLIHALLTLLGGAAVLVVYLFIYKGLAHLCFGHLSKKSCKYFLQAARIEKSPSGPDGLPRHQFVLENPVYAELFIKANGGEP